MAQCNAAPKQSAPAVEQPATAAKQTNRVAKQADASLHDSTQKTAKPTFEVQSAPNDSSLVMQHISKALKYKASIAQDIAADRQRQLLLLHIARGFCGIPYVAKTLENDSKENLVVNLRQLDCTTYVENVLAVYECVKHNRTSYADYLHFLRRIRYVYGNVNYSARQHYFTEWIEENTKDGFVREINTPNPPFNTRQTLSISFMSTHTDAYPMLKNNPEMVKPIAEMERRLSGNTYMYIPKGDIKNTKLLRSAIHDGDIIAIITKKKGLDTSHIGIAVWHKDGLHMLNASQIHKKVVEEPMTLHNYMQKHPSQVGIRIVRIN